MAVESPDDLAGMLADWDTARIGGVDVAGIFGHRYVEVQGMESALPTFQAASADVAAVAHGDTVTVAGDAYVVAEIQPDGTGLTLLVLQVAP